MQKVINNKKKTILFWFPVHAKQLVFVFASSFGGEY